MGAVALEQEAVTECHSMTVWILTTTKKVLNRLLNVEDSYNSSSELDNDNDLFHLLTLRLHHIWKKKSVFQDQVLLHFQSVVTVKKDFLILKRTF